MLLRQWQSVLVVMVNVLKMCESMKLYLSLQKMAVFMDARTPLGFRFSCLVCSWGLDASWFAALDATPKMVLFCITVGYILLFNNNSIFSFCLCYIKKEIKIIQRYI